MWNHPPKHTPKLPKDLGPFKKPVFTALSKQELLEKCVLGATQNQNESFNNIFWSRCPKTGFCSVVSVDIAVNLAAIILIMDWKDSRLYLSKLLALPQVHLQPTIYHLRMIKIYEGWEECTNQSQRKSLRSKELAVEERHIAGEGITYESGGF